MNSRFEFLGNTAIGQYIPRDSLIHCLDPRARMLIYLALFTGVVFTPRISGLFLGLGMVLLLYILAKIPVKPGWQSFKRAAIFIDISSPSNYFRTITHTDVILGNVVGIIVTQRSFQRRHAFSEVFILIFY